MIISEKPKIIVYDVEKKTEQQLKGEIYEQLKEKGIMEKAILFKIESELHIKRRYELIELIKKHATVSFRDTSDYCLYCEENITHKKGIFCDELCEQLKKEEIK